MGKTITDYRDLRVFQIAMRESMEIFLLSKSFPKDERYSLTDQIRRSSRSVSVNIAEAWKKRRYSKSFLFTLTIADSEASETRVWLEYALKCGYIENDQFLALDNEYDKISAMLYKMMHSYDQWTGGAG